MTSRRLMSTSRVSGPALAGSDPSLRACLVSLMLTDLGAVAPKTRGSGLSCIVHWASRMGRNPRGSGDLLHAEREEVVAVRGRRDGGAVAGR